MHAEIIAFFRGAFLRHDPHRFAVMQPQSADRKYHDHPGQLTDSQIAAHLDGRAAYAVPTAENGLASFLPLDVDAGGITAIAALMDAAAARQLWAFAQYDPAAGRGYVWVPFDDLTHPERLHQLGAQLIAQVQPQAHGWKIENRATAEDTRLPFARHRWTGKRGILETPGGQLTDLDALDRLPVILERFARDYRENPTSTLPPPPDTAPEAPRKAAGTPSGPGVTIDAYNARADLVSLIGSYGAKPARGQGRNLYFCPFHGDSHASLLIGRGGERCKCLSTGSGCPLSEGWHDAFSVFCTGEGITPTQALRRLNGQPDDGEPGRGPQTPPAATEGTRGQGGALHTPTPPEGSTAGQRNAPNCYPSSRRPATDAVQASQAVLDLPATAADIPHLPKTARRALDVIAQHPGGYIRGKYHLARLLDVDPRTVQRSLRRLEAEGLICRQQRGRDGQTDIYQLASRRPATSGPIQAEQPAGGRQLPPTVDIKIIVPREPEEARRGGNPPALAPAPQGDDGAAYGPGGAVAYPHGAAYVPPEAVSWYAAQVQAQECEEAPPDAPAEAEQGALLPATEKAEPLAAITPATPARARRRKKARAPKFQQPAELLGRIIAAERAAEKLKRTNPRQAAAIRRNAEQLRARYDAMRAEMGDTAQEAPRQPARAAPRVRAAPVPSGPAQAEATPAPPPGSLPGVDFGEVARGLADRLRQRQAAGAV